MKVLRTLFLRIRSLQRRGEVKREIDEELRFHLEQRAAENIAAGMAPDQAEREARKRFGNFQTVREECRARRGASFGEETLRDLRFALRQLLKNPGFTAVAVLTLALGIGANTGLFTILYALVWQPLPVKDPASVVNIHQSFAGPSSRQALGGINRLSYPEYLNYRDRVRSLAGLAAFEEANFTFGGANVSRVPGVFATGNYFSVLGATTALGRVWSAPECEIPGACSVVVLSHGFWQRHFGGDRGVVGRTISLNRQTLTVIGVAAREFRGTDPNVPDVWVPLMMRSQLMTDEPDRLAAKDYSWLKAVGRLKRGVSLAEARREFAVVAQESDADPTITSCAGRKTQLRVKTGAYFNSPEDISNGLPVVAVVMAAIGLVLVVVCANVSNLLLARASVRRREFGVRQALGASRARLIRQLLTESGLLAGMAGVAGLALAFALPRLLLAGFPLDVLPAFNLSPNFPVLGYCTMVSLVAAICVGLAPALQTTRLELSSALAAQGALLGERIGGAKLRNVLMITQVAVSMLLLITAGLLLRGLRHALSADLGFDRANLLVVSADLAASGYNTAQAQAFNANLIERLAGVPGVKATALAIAAPFMGSSSTTVRLDRQDSAAANESGQANFNTVSPGYFKTIGIVIVRGRNLTEADVQNGARVTVINQAMAHRFWPGEDPIGHRFFARDPEPYQIVGIARDLSSLVPGAADGPYFYLPAMSNGESGLQLLVRADALHSISLKTMHDLAVGLDPKVAVSVRTVEENVDRTLAPARLASMLAGALGLLALGLVVIGVYGVTAYVVNQRTREIGVRVALGAQSWMIQRQMIGEGVRVVTVGIILGLALAAMGSRVLRGVIFGLSARDPVTFLGVAALLLTVSVLACWLPARRATKVDPMVALRHE